MKTVDTAYPCPDPVQSYVPGENDVIAMADAVDPPHGFRELGVASRHIFGHGACDDIVAQIWRTDETPSVFGASYELKATWYVPVDEVFDTLEVLVYYTASAEVDEFAKFVLAGGGEVKLDGVAAGGATRVAKATWSTSDIETMEESATITMYLKGLGFSGNVVHAVYIRRVAPTSIADGTYYGGLYVPPDDVQTDEDEFLPVAEDILDDLAIGLEAIQDNRRKLYAGWARTTTVADGGFALLAPYSGVNPTLHAMSDADQDGACLGGTTLDDQDYRTEFELVDGDKAEIEVSMDPLPFIAGLGQFYLTFDSPNSLVTWTIEGV